MFISGNSISKYTVENVSQDMKSEDRRLPILCYISLMGKASRKKKTLAKTVTVDTSRNRESATSVKTGFLDKPVVYILIIIIWGLLVYSNTFHATFQFDDRTNIIENYKLRYLSNFWPPSGLRWSGFLTFAINYHLGGLNTFGYHILNISIHIFNSILVYWLVILTFKTPVLKDTATSIYSRHIALFSSLIFLSHPIQTQAVTYIVQRFTSLATFFYLLSLVMYINFRLKAEQQCNRTAEQQVEKKSYCATALLLYCSSLISAILAMKTKEISFTLPFIIVLYEFCFLTGTPNFKRFLYLLPLLLTLLIIPFSLIGIDKPIGEVIGELREAPQETEEISRWDYLFTQFRVIVTYIRLLFLPVNQNLDYDYPVLHSFLNPNVFLSFLFFLSILAFAFYCFYASRVTRHALRIVAFGILWFFIALSVESSVIPITDVIFEHRVYLPSVGVFVAVITAVFIAANRLRSKGLPIEKILVAAFVFLIIVFAGATYARNMVWQDEITLWSDVVKKSRHKARGFNNLAVAYVNAERIDKAIEIYYKIISMTPDYSGAYYNIGVIYDKKGQIDKALEMYDKAISINPDFAGAYNSRGVAYSKKGLDEKAIGDYSKAITMNPENFAAYYNRAISYIDRKQFDLAIKDLSSAVAINPNLTNAYYKRGLVYALTGNMISAISDLRKSCSMGYEKGCQALKSALEKIKR